MRAFRRKNVQLKERGFYCKEKEGEGGEKEKVAVGNWALKEGM